MRNIAFIRYLRSTEKDWDARGIAAPLNDTIILNVMAKIASDITNREVAEILHEAFFRCAQRLEKQPIVVSEDELERMRGV